MPKSQPIVANAVTSLRQEARAAFERRDLSKCIGLLEKLTRLTPTDPAAFLQLGRVQGLTYDYEAARAAFERVYRMAPEGRKAEALFSAAQHARGFYHPDIADQLLQRAVEHKDVRAGTLVLLAESCERHRQLDEGESLVTRALQLDPNCELASLVQARLLQRKGCYEDAGQLLRHLLTRTSSNEVRIRAGSELGAVLDRLGRYDEAMQAFVQAKELLRPLAEPQIAPRQFQREQLAQLRAQISPEVFKRWADEGAGLQPRHRLALLGGHPRSGTTLLEQVLDAHPEVVSIEETTHFADCAYAPMRRRHTPTTPMLQALDSVSPELLDAYRRRYVQSAELCLREPVGSRMLVDKNPALTVFVPALARVFPEIKLLIALRDPRDVVLSCFLQPVLSVDQVHYAYLSLKTTVEGYTGLMNTWRTIAPMLQNPWLEVRYEDMVDDLPSVAQRTLDFLGVPWNDAVLKFDEHAQQKWVRSPTYADVSQKVFSRARGRWRNYQKHLEPHLPMLDPFVKALGYE